MHKRPCHGAAFGHTKINDAMVVTDDWGQRWVGATLASTVYTVRPQQQSSPFAYCVQCLHMEAYCTSYWMCIERCSPLQGCCTKGFTTPYVPHADRIGWRTLLQYLGAEDTILIASRGLAIRRRQWQAVSSTVEPTIASGDKYC